MIVVATSKGITIDSGKTYRVKNTFINVVLIVIKEAWKNK